MAVRIRLRRVGRKKQPSYRIVVADSATPRDGNYLEAVGFYNPRTSPAELRLDLEKTEAWIGKGATPTDTVASLIRKARSGGDETIGYYGAEGEDMPEGGRKTRVAPPKAQKRKAAPADTEAEAAPEAEAAEEPAEVEASAEGSAAAAEEPAEPEAVAEETPKAEAAEEAEATPEAEAAEEPAEAEATEEAPEAAAADEAPEAEAAAGEAPEAEAADETPEAEADEEPEKEA